MSVAGGFVDTWQMTSDVLLKTLVHLKNIYIDSELADFCDFSGNTHDYYRREI